MQFPHIPVRPGKRSALPGARHLHLHGPRRLPDRGCFGASGRGRFGTSSDKLGRACRMRRTAPPPSGSHQSSHLRAGFCRVRRWLSTGTSRSAPRRRICPTAAASRAEWRGRFASRCAPSTPMQIHRPPEQPRGRRAILHAWMLKPAGTRRPCAKRTHGVETSCSLDCGARGMAIQRLCVQSGLKEAA